jgi:Divergent AAA domain.
MVGRSLFDRLKKEGWKVVEELISDHSPETLYLEFKCKAHDGQPGRLHDDDKKNLAKTISAFANTEGGCLVFGISTARDKGDAPDYAKEAQPINALGAFKGCVEAILKDVVNPAPAGIELEAVENRSGSDQGVLAIYVPQSIGRPHRANMGPGEVREHYYQRSGSRSDIMPHSMLAALLGRVPSPSLYLRFWIWGEEQLSTASSILRFSLELWNEGRGTARQPAIRLFEVEEKHRGFWGEAINSMQLEQGWWTATNPRNEATKEEGTILLSSSPEAVVYPGDRLLLNEGDARFPGGWNPGASLSVQIKGAIYAVDAPPVEFDQKLTMTVRYEKMPLRLPERPLLAL